MYEMYYKAENYLKNTEPMARVGLVYSEQTEQHYGGKPWQQRPGDHENGMYHLLVEDRTPFEMVNDQLLDEEHLKRFKVLIFSNVAALSDAQCAQIRQFVERGGSVVATFETSLYDETGKQRADFGLADMFGVAFDNKVEGPMRNSYLKFEQDPTTRQFHPVVKGLEDAYRMINALYRVNVSPKA
jgi:beta-galactosidase GanA